MPEEIVLHGVGIWRKKPITTTERIRARHYIKVIEENYSDINGTEEFERKLIEETGFDLGQFKKASTSKEGYEYGMYYYYKEYILCYEICYFILFKNQLTH
ncbi:MAG: hypothetical protein V4547_16570 [Bacteroidota bacterium]